MPSSEPSGINDVLLPLLLLPEGVAVGAAVGFAVGFGVGFAVGFGVGSGVGSTVGSGVGFTVGSGVGSGVGSIVGSGVGSSVGSGVISATGFSVGSGGVSVPQGVGAGFSVTTTSSEEPSVSVLLPHADNDATITAVNNVAISFFFIIVPLSFI